jgi:hypothetical protein
MFKLRMTDNLIKILPSLSLSLSLAALRARTFDILR